jgi:alpha-D-xyloside xylohydrolase
MEHYEQGAFATIDIRWQDAAHCLTIGSRQGHYPGMQQQRELIVVLGKQGKSVIYTGQEITVALRGADA